ncbi:MAG: hypothetical protein HKN33_09055 [Pyrinomonadaceae bacterium]|nr:hypothetical protein [Pyrinomonadaceae bacterium]
MGRIVVLVLLLLVISTVVFIGGSYLVVYWRDTTRRWRLEKQADRKRQIREAKEEFMESAKAMDELGSRDKK